MQVLLYLKISPKGHGKFKDMNIYQLASARYIHAASAVVIHSHVSPYLLLLWMVSDGFQASYKCHCIWKWAQIGREKSETYEYVSTSIGIAYPCSLCCCDVIHSHVPLHLQLLGIISLSQGTWRQAYTSMEKFEVYEYLLISLGMALQHRLCLIHLHLTILTGLQPSCAIFPHFLHVPCFC